MQIREATPADVETLLDLWEALIACGTAADPRFQLAENGRAHMRDYVLSWFDAPPFPRAWLAEVDGAPAGFVHGIPVQPMPLVKRAATVRIGDMYVADAFRRRGIARMLVETQLRAARDAGYPRAEVGTLVADERAVAFWKSVGFADWQVLFSLEP